MNRPEVGDRRRAVSPPITRTQIVQFACATGDLSPLHVDTPRAVAEGYPSVLAHGMLTMAAAGDLLAGWCGEENLTTFGVRFLAPVWPGDELTTTATITAVRDTEVDIALTATTQSDVTVLTGTATARVGGTICWSFGRSTSPDDHQNLQQIAPGSGG